jgi:hypothetical protein
MQTNEVIKFKGSLNITVKDAEGNIKDEREVNNLVVDTGLAYIISRMKDASATAMSHMAIGTSATAAADAQTALLAEVGRVALASSTITTTTVANDTLTYAATFPAGTGTGAIVEAGILNAAGAGTLLARTVFAVINKGALDSMTVIWNVRSA